MSKLITDALTDGTTTIDDIDNWLQYHAASWFYWDQTGPTLFDSFNVSSVTDDGSGVGTSLFINGFNDAETSWGDGWGDNLGGNERHVALHEEFNVNSAGGGLTTFGWRMRSTSGSQADSAHNYCVVGGELT